MVSSISPKQLWVLETTHHSYIPAYTKLFFDSDSVALATESKKIGDLEITTMISSYL